jgi:hypothetical protein
MKMRNKTPKEEDRNSAFAFAEIKEQFKKEEKNTRNVYIVSLGVILLIIFLFLLFSPFRIYYFSDFGDKILGRYGYKIEEIIEDKIQEEETNYVTEEISKEKVVEDENLNESPAQIKQSSIKENIIPSTPSINSKPILKCSQYDFDYATAYIATSEKIYAEQYAKYLQELAKYQNCMYGKSWDQIYYECEEGLLAILNPLVRDEYARACVKRYYENCELNSAVQSYLKILQNIEIGINEQKIVLKGCY